MERFCREDVRDLSLTQAFYKLLDENKEYWCSLSTLYRLFRARGFNARRAPPTREARLRSRPTTYTAEKPNEVWTWDIDYLRSSTYMGRSYYAYVSVGVYSRMVCESQGGSTLTMLIFPWSFTGMPSENMDSGPDSLSCTQTMAQA